MTYSADKQNITLEIARHITELQNGSGYGSIEIILDDGRVTLIEKREKLRFNGELSKSAASTTLNAQSTVTTDK